MRCVDMNFMAHSFSASLMSRNTDEGNIKMTILSNANEETSITRGEGEEIDSARCRSSRCEMNEEKEKKKGEEMSNERQ